MASDQSQSVPPIPVPPAAAQSEAAESESSAAPVPAPEPVRPNPYAAQQPSPAPSPYGTAVQQPAAQSPGYQPYPYQPGQYTPGPPSGLSITSMVLGIVSLVFTLFAAGLLPGIAAVITGHLGARRQPHAKGFWLTGIITGYVSIGIGLVIVAIFALIIVVGVTSGS